MTRHIKGWLVAALVLVAAAASRGEPGDPGAIRVWPTAVVTAGTVTLADVADLTGFDSATQQKLAAIVVRTAPSAGGEILISVNDLRTSLAAADANLASISFLGSAKCRVSKPRPVREEPAVAKPVRKRVAPAPPPPKPQHAEPIAPPRQQVGTAEVPKAKTLEGALREFITARSPDPEARLDIRFNAAGAELLKLPAEENEFRIRPANDRRLGILSFEVQIEHAGEAGRTEAVVAEVQLVREVVVARRPINRGETIEGSALKLEERPFNDMEAVGLTELAAAVGQQSGDFVRQGEMLRPETLKSKPLVQRGDTVTIWARLGGVEIKTTGKAQRAGTMGETIVVSRDGTKRVQDLIEAVVTGPKTVTIADGRRLASR